MHDEISAMRHDLDAILAGAAQLGLDPPPMREPDFPTLWRALSSQRDDPWLPLWVGAAVPYGHYEAIDYLCAAHSTLGQGLAALVRHYALITTKVELSLAGARLRIRPRHGLAQARQVVGMYITGLILSRFRAACAHRLELSELTLASSAQADYGPLERWCGAPVLEGNECFELRFEAGDLALPLRQARPELSTMLEDYAEGLARRRGLRADPLAQIRQAIRAELELEGATLEGVARRLGTGERTLQRRLGDAGLSFRALLAEQRLAWALSLLERRELGLSEIALRMGYSEHSAFTRAFKRWTGASPLSYRRRQQAHRAPARRAPSSTRALSLAG